MSCLTSLTFGVPIFKFTIRISISLLMPPGRAVDTAGAVQDRAAPDALVRARAVTMLARRAVNATRTATRRTAMSAFRTHSLFRNHYIKKACREKPSFRQEPKTPQPSIFLSRIDHQNFPSRTLTSLSRSSSSSPAYCFISRISFSMAS